MLRLKLLKTLLIRPSTTFSHRKIWGEGARRVREESKEDLELDNLALVRTIVKNSTVCRKISRHFFTHQGPKSGN